MVCVGVSMKIKDSFAFGRELTLEENRGVQLEILRFVDRYCNEAGLRYYLGDGTLLGAIRHRGFIPWDDDIDLRMPRPDYMRLLRGFNDYAKDSPYRLIDPKEARAKYFFLKIIDKRTVKIEQAMDNANGLLGVDIDVFPLDGCPEEEEAFQAWATELQGYHKAYMYKKKTWIRKIAGRTRDIVRKRTRAKLLPGMSCAAIMDKVYEMTARYPFDESKYICGVVIIDRFRMPRECFAGHVMVPFEGEEFRAPVGWDAYLKAQYGDYMRLPPKEQQVSHHTNKAYWVE